jgi:hypothetical protein
MSAVVIEGAGRTSKDGNIAFKALQQFRKSTNFTAGTVEVFIVP